MTKNVASEYRLRRLERTYDSLVREIDSYAQKSSVVIPASISAIGISLSINNELSVVSICMMATSLALNVINIHLQTNKLNRFRLSFEGIPLYSETDVIEYVSRSEEAIIGTASLLAHKMNIVWVSGLFAFGFGFATLLMEGLA